MKVKIIRCNNSKKEYMYVLLTLMFIFLTALTLLKLNSRNIYIKKLKSDEILNTNLTYNENLIYSELKNFAFTYEFLKDSNSLTINNLKNDLLIEPFYSENSIEKEYFWEIKENHNYVAYIGRSEKNADMFLILDLKKGNYDIYYKKNIKNNLDIDDIIHNLSNYKKIVAYTANEYIKEGKGKE